MKTLLTVSLIWLAGLNQAQAISVPKIATEKAAAAEAMIATEGSVPQSTCESVNEDCASELRHDSNAYIGDSRQELGANQYPWTVYGRLVSPHGGLCSATLVGADVILTAGHCVIDKTTGEVRRGQYRFQLGYNRGSQWATAGVRLIWTIYNNTNTGEDWAILKIDRRLGDRFGWLGVQSMTVDQMMNDRRTLYLNGYGSDYHGMEVPFWQKGCNFRNFGYDNTALHDCSMSSGSSGSAMVVWDGNRQQMLVVGVNVAEYRHHTENGGRSLTGIPYSDLKANVAVPSVTFFNTLTTAQNTP